MQGDTGGYGGTQTPTREGLVLVYNVWSDDCNVDEWTYDPMEAIAMRQLAGIERTGPIHVTRYEEVDGDVNTQDRFERVTDEDLEDDDRYA